jgi:hypothetical protein
LLLCLPVAAALSYWLLRGKTRPSRTVLALRCRTPAGCLSPPAAAWLGYFDNCRNWGSPLTLPYTVSRIQYAMPLRRYFIWQSQRPEPHYNHHVMRAYYHDTEQRFADYSKGPILYLLNKISMALVCIQFYAGIALWPPLIMVRRVFLDRRIRFLIVCVLVLTAGMSIQVFVLAHYLAPFTAAFYAIGLQCTRHLRLWNPGGKPVGLTLSRLVVFICVLMGVARLYAGPLHLALPEYPGNAWNLIWYGPDHFGTERVRVEEFLRSQPGKQLAIVHYSDRHNPYNEWVYNAADIETSPVIWADEMDDAQNRELVHYYNDRTVWLVQPDQQPAGISKYSTEAGKKTDSH